LTKVALRRTKPPLIAVVATSATVGILCIG